MQGFRRERRSVSRLTAHLVCVTKYRCRLLDSQALEWLQGRAIKVFATMGCELLACDGEAGPPADRISAKVFDFGACQCIQGNIQPTASQDASRHSLAECEWRFMVAKLFRCINWRSDSRNGQSLRGTAARFLLALKREVSSAENHDDVQGGATRWRRSRRRRSADAHRGFAFVCQCRIPRSGN